MKINDGKDVFLRKLNFDKDTRKLIRSYRILAKKMQNEPENKKGVK